MKNTQELKEYLHERGYDDTVVFENPDYITAIVGLSEDGRLIYDFDKMVEHLVNTDGMDAEEAIEFVEFNTIQSLSSAGAMAPIVMYPMDE